jgi:beta-lactamase class A
MLEAGELPAPVSCRDLAEGMITVSDNAATNLLI